MGSARGSRIVTEASEVGSVEKDAGKGTFNRTGPSHARIVTAKSGGDAEPSTRSAEVGRATVRCPSMPSGVGGESSRAGERVMTPRPCVIGVCIAGAERPAATLSRAR